MQIAERFAYEVVVWDDPWHVPIAHCKEQIGDRKGNLKAIFAIADIHHSDASAHLQGRGHALKHRREHGHQVLKYLLRAPPHLHEDAHYEVERLQNVL